MHPRMAMVANFSSTNQNPTVNGGVDYPNKHCSTKGPLITAISSKYPLDQPSCSSQQEFLFEEHNTRDGYAIYDMDSPTGSKFKVCNADFKKIPRKEHKVDLSTKLNVSCY